MLLALALAFAPHVAATTVEPLDEAALGARSDLIARVVVTSARAERVGRRIITFYEVDVVEAWQTRDAAAPRRALVALPGGTVGDVGQLVPGTPVLEVGQSYVLCLGDDTGPAPAATSTAGPAIRARGVVGLWQGAFAVLDSGRLRAFVHGPQAGGGEEALDATLLRARFGAGATP